MKMKQLSESELWLIRKCQQVNFGRITLHVRGGEPDLGRPWRTRQTVKLAGGENGPRRETDVDDFELRQEQSALLATIGQVSDGLAVNVEVRHGLPFLVEIEQDHEAA